MIKKEEMAEEDLEVGLLLISERKKVPKRRIQLKLLITFILALKSMVME